MDANLSSQWKTVTIANVKKSLLFSKDGHDCVLNKVELLSHSAVYSAGNIAPLESQAPTAKIKHPGCPGEGYWASLIKRPSVEKVLNYITPLKNSFVNKTMGY